MLNTSKWSYATLPLGARLSKIRNGENDVYAQEVARTNQLIKDRNEVGLDVSEQMAYLKKLSDVRNNIDKTLTPEEIDYHMKTDSELLQVSKLSNDFSKLINPTGTGTSSESDNQLKSVQRGLDNQKQSRLNILNTSNVTSNNNFGSDDIIKEMQLLQGNSSVASLSNTFDNKAAYAMLSANAPKEPRHHDDAGHDLKPMKPWEKEKLQKEEAQQREEQEQKQLKADLKEETKKYKKLGQDIATMFINNDDDAESIVEKNSSNIDKATELLDIDPALIQAVLYQEIRFFNYADYVADSAVESTQSYYQQLDIYSNLSSWQKMLRGTPTITVPLQYDSSTGLGQIFAKTAINALNWYSGSESTYDIDDMNTVFDVWNNLRNNDEYNIYMAGLVLKHAAYMVSEKNSGIYDLSSKYIDSLSDEERKTYISNVLARYNGTNAQAKEYGEHVYQYYNAFDKYNKKKK